MSEAWSPLQAKASLISIPHVTSRTGNDGSCTPSSEMHVCTHTHTHTHTHAVHIPINTHTKVCVLVTQSCPTLCNARNYSPLGSFVHGVPQARILEWVAISSSRGSSRPRDRNQFSCITGRRFTTEPQGRPSLQQERKKTPQNTI